MLRRPAQVTNSLNARPAASWPAALAAVVVSVSLGACAGGPSLPMELAQQGSPQETASTPSAPQTELQKATEYWGKQVAQNPGDAQAAINYARNLKALGSKQEALAILQQAHAMNPNHKGLNSEYGRAALDANQIAAAQKLLDNAADPVAPDWKTISARGTLMAKQGRHREAIALFEQARGLAPEQTSILNNLALAHAMDGRAEKAEAMLRDALAKSPADERISRNLALVLGLQGKHEEAKTIVARALPPEEAAEDASFMKQMVKAQPQPDATATSPSAQPQPVAAPAKSAQAGGKSSISTASVAKPAPGKSMAPVADATALVQKLADGQAAAPTDQPINLLPKR